MSTGRGSETVADGVSGFQLRYPYPRTRSTTAGLCARPNCTGTPARRSCRRTRPGRRSDTRKWPPRRPTGTCRLTRRIRITYGFRLTTVSIRLLRNVYVRFGPVRFHQSHGTPRRRAGALVLRDFGPVRRPAVHHRPYGQPEVFVQTANLQYLRKKTFLPDLYARRGVYPFYVELYRKRSKVIQDGRFRLPDIRFRVDRFRIWCLNDPSAIVDERKRDKRNPFGRPPNRKLPRITLLTSSGNSSFVWPAWLYVTG